MKQILIIWVAGLTTTQTAQAQQRLSMEQVEQAIQAYHPALKMLDAEAQSMEEEAKGAYNWMPPELGAGFFQTPYNPINWKNMNGQPGMGMFMISAQQMFPNRKSQKADFAYLKARSATEKQKKNVILNELLFTARKNYYDWIVLDQKLAVLNDNYNLLSFMIQSAEIRYKNGLGKISAYYKAKAALANISNMRIMLLNEITQKKIILNTVMNRSPNAALLIDSSYRWINFTQSMFDTVALMKQRSDIKVIERSIEVNNLQREAELVKLKPQFGIRYDHMTPLGNRPLMYTLMGMVRIPLAKWSSRMNKAKAESLLWENEALKNQQQLILNEATGMAASSLAELESKKQQLLLYQNQIIPALQKNFQSMQLAYEQNTEELFELFDAWEAMNNMQMEYLDQLQKALALQAELMKIAEIK
jgi:outer membrane protein TolC